MIGSPVSGASLAADLPPLGVIAGTGFYALDDLLEAHDIELRTSYGSASATIGRLHGRRTIFVSRHGSDHRVPPHRINARAIIQALSEAGVRQILAVNVVGGIGHQAGELVVVDDFLDFTRQRPLTFFDGDSTSAGVVHADMGEPYDASLRSALIEAAGQLGIAVVPHGIYACFEGPRFETRAEIRMAQAAGATVVGMTGVPEVVLAVERGIAYASICLVANPAAGLGTVPITIEDVNAVVAQGAAQVTAILGRAAADLARRG